jgi:type VI protein secretion system component Hcp
VLAVKQWDRRRVIDRPRVAVGNGRRRPVQKQAETIMSKRDEKLEQKSSVKVEISGTLDDNSLEKVTGGGKANPKEAHPTETISLNYGHIEWTYTQQN